MEVDCICESPKMPGLTEYQVHFVILKLKEECSFLKHSLRKYKSKNYFDDEELREYVIFSTEEEIAQLEEIIDCLEEK